MDHGDLDPWTCDPFFNSRRTQLVQLGLGLTVPPTLLGVPRVCRK